MKKIISIVLALVLIAGAGYLLVSKTPTKDGEELIFKTKFNEMGTSEYYGLLKEYYDADYVYQRFEKDLLSGMERSEKIKESALQQKQQLEESLQESGDAESNKQNIILTLKSLGYKGFDEVALYFENYLLRNEIISTYLFENLDTYFDTYYTDAKPRYASHILFKVEDLSAVSESEKNTMENIRNRALAGEDFAALAKEFSSDSSKDIGGELGLMDVNTQFVEPFLNAALALETGAISEWVESEFGFHLIIVDTSNKETLQKDASIIANMMAANPQIDKDAMKLLIEKSNVTFNDETTKTTIMSHFDAKGNE